MCLCVCVLEVCSDACTFIDPIIKHVLLFRPDRRPSLSRLHGAFYSANVLFIATPSISLGVVHENNPIDNDYCTWQRSEFFYTNIMGYGLSMRKCRSFHTTIIAFVSVTVYCRSAERNSEMIQNSKIIKLCTIQN